MINIKTKSIVIILSIILGFSFSFSFSLCMPSFAANSFSLAQMRETLVKIVNQLQAIKPLIAEAEREQPQNPRIKIHFSGKFRDQNGKLHNGLRQDIEAIQKALIKILNQQGKSIEPRSYAPITGDFIGYGHV